jgi:hypothetical protein
VAAALAALRSWAFARVEKGDALDTIIADILGPPETCAAFVLVAVDLLRSVDSLPLETAVPFVGSPELLCLERQNSTLDLLHGSTRSYLPTRGPTFTPQRLPPLEYLLHPYVRPHNAGPREILRKHLQDATRRLGPPEADSNYGDPRLMALLAMNRINPDNWSADPQNPGSALNSGTPQALAGVGAILFPSPAPLLFDQSRPLLFAQSRRRDWGANSVD